jgi:hypothetical protein
MWKTAFTLLKIVLISSLCAGGILAKTIKVKIDSVQETAKDVGKSISARLQGTERYAITEGDAELYLQLTCLQREEATSASSYVCSFVILYFPEKMAPMQSLLGPHGLVTGRDGFAVAEVVFTSFVAGTTNEQLEKAQKHLRMGVNGYCHSTIFDKDVRADCGQNLGK